MKKILYFRWFVVTITLSLLVYGCGSSKGESCSFDLDGGDYDAAVTNCAELLTSDTSNLKSALWLSSAYAGRANVELLGVMQDYQEQEDSTQDDNDFGGIHTVMSSIIQDSTDLDDLRSSITSLQAPAIAAQPAATDPLYASFFFQLGIYQAFEAFTLPTMRAQPAGVATYNVDLITQTDYENVLADFLEADDNLEDKAGQDDSSIVDMIRQNYWSLERASAGAQFSLNDLKDLIQCELDDNPDAITTFYSSVTTCADFEFRSADTDTDTE